MTMPYKFQVDELKQQITRLQTTVIDMNRNLQTQQLANAASFQEQREETDKILSAVQQLLLRKSQVTEASVARHGKDVLGKGN